MAKDTYYFSHDANARNDEKILMLRAEHGMVGYGLYWCLLEMMFESADTKLSHGKLRGAAVSYNVDITVLNDVINTCVTEGLFVSNGEKFWSESLIRRKEKLLEFKQKKSEAGKKGMASRYANKGIDNTVITEPNTVITVPNKGNEIKGNEIKGNEKDIPPNPPKPSNKATKVQYAEFVTMTEKEYTTLVEKHGEGKTREIIEILDNYKGSKGETYKSDYRAILSWVIKRWDEDNDRKGKADGKNQNAKKLAEQYNLGF